MLEFLFYIICIYLIFITINFLFALCVTIILDGLTLLYELLFQNKNIKTINKPTKHRKNVKNEINFNF